MIFTQTRIAGLVCVDIERREDERGFFARTWCRDEFGQKELSSELVQCSISFNKVRGTLRGLHYQVDPWPEAKLVRCTRGSLYDVVVDLRRDSSTFRKWVALELNAENRRMLYISPGLAHGFQTLSDETEVFYQMSERFHPEAASGVRWNDPAFGITWPIENPILSLRDAAWSDFT